MLFSKRRNMAPPIPSSEHAYPVKFFDNHGKAIADEVTHYVGAMQLNNNNNNSIIPNTTTPSVPTSQLANETEQQQQDMVLSSEVLLLEDVLKKNDEEFLYDQIMELAKTVEDDPVIIFAWKNVEAFVHAIAAAQHADPPGPPPPPTLVLSMNMTVHDFKIALLNYARVPGAAAPLATTALPFTILQSCHCVGGLVMLDNDPWTRHIIALHQQQQQQHGASSDILPIAAVCLPRPFSNILDYAMEPFKSNSLWG